MSSSTFDRQLARELVEEARALIGSGELESARLLLERAHGIDPESGEPLFFLASIIPHERNTVYEREWLLRRALSLEHSDETGERLATHLARLLIDSGRSDEAVTLLDAYAGAIAQAMERIRAHDTGIPQPADVRNVPDVDRLFLEARLRAFPGWFTSSLMGYLRARYPRDEQLARLDWERQRRIGPGLLEWIEATGDETEVLRDTILRFPGTERDVFVELVARYYQRNGRDPVPAAISLVRQEGVDQPVIPEPDVLEALVRSALDDGDKVIWESVAVRSEPVQSWQERLPALFRNVAESIQRSSDWTLYRPAASGLGEARYNLEQGFLHRWILDRDGNGRSDLALEVHRDTLYLYERADDSVVVIRFSRYPLVSEVYELQIVPDPRRPDRRHLVPPGEMVAADHSRRWMPAQPVTYDPALHIDHPHKGRIDYDGIAGPGGFLLWDILAGRVTFEQRAHERFERQLASDNARGLSEAEAREMAGRLRSLELLR